MVYITVKQPPAYHQMTLEEYLFADANATLLLNQNISNTKTYKRECISDVFTTKIDVQKMIQRLILFNTSTEELRQVDRKDLYYTFFIPKKSGGFRRIDAPNPDLMSSLRELKSIFEKEFGVLYHTSAFAYVKKRCAVDAVKKHQKNDSKWFAKLDLSNFFGSTTLNFTMKMLSMVFPFSEIVKDVVGKEELQKAIELGFLNGGLPQGTPLSPFLTNVIMIPIDYQLTKALKRLDNQKYIYTRYADDFLISSRYDFKIREIEDFVINTLAEFEAPFSINQRKTRYGSSSGSNWNLGVMLNQENKITVGHKKKRIFKTALFNYVTDKSNNIEWTKEDVQILQGTYSYYCSVERENIDTIISQCNQKYNIDVLNLIKLDIKRL